MNEHSKYIYENNAQLSENNTRQNSAFYYNLWCVTLPEVGPLSGRHAISYLKDFNLRQAKINHSCCLVPGPQHNREAITKKKLSWK